MRPMKGNELIYNKVQKRLKGYRWIGFAGPARAGRESNAVDDWVEEVKFHMMMEGAVFFMN